MSNTQWPSPEQLMDWAKNRPDELERFKQREINKLIDQSPDNMKRRLRGLQFQIDCKSRLHSNPLASCIAISHMMLESVSELNDVLNGNKRQTRYTPRSTKASHIIPFPAAAN